MWIEGDGGQVSPPPTSIFCIHLNINSLKINVNDIVLGFYEKSAQTLTAIVTLLLFSRGSEIRGAIVRIAKANTILKRLLRKLLKIHIMALTKQIT